MKFDVKFNEANSFFTTNLSVIDQSFVSDFGMLQEVMVGGTTDHKELLNRDADNQHPISAITDLEATLEDKLETIPTMSNQDIENILKGFV